jgi:hypothetical protein
MKINFFSGKAYKFCSIDTLQKIVEHEKLRLARADTFNDPHESNPFLIPLEWEALTQIKNNPQKIVRSIANEAFVKICGSIYITCFCQNYLQQRSTLMWAHYANNHRGVCFEVNFPKVTTDNYSKGDIIPINVTYVNSLAEERNKRTPESDDLPLFIATYKSDVWQYEEEVRIVVESTSFDKTKFVEVNDRKNIDLDFDITSISKVTFGLRTSEKEIEETVKLFCRKGHLPDFFKIDIHPVTIEFCEHDLGIKQEIIKHNTAR